MRSIDLSYVVPVKYMVEISQNFVAFSEYMNFTVLNLIVMTATVVELPSDVLK